MSTNYPGALDSFVNPTATDTLDSATVPHAAQHDNANDSIRAIQVTLGVNPQGGSATVVARLTALDSTVAGKAATDQTMYVGTTAIAINRSSASQNLTGVNIDGNAGTATTAGSATTAANLSGTQTAKFVYAAPNAANGTASFRALVASDVPILNQDTTGNASTATNLASTTTNLASNVTASSLTSFGTDPTANTQAVDNNSTKIATTAFVLGQAASATPAMDGTAAVGTSTRYARADHVHGSDTTKANLSGATFTGAVAISSGNLSQTGSGQVLVQSTSTSAVPVVVKPAGSLTITSLTASHSGGSGVLFDTVSGFSSTVGLVAGQSVVLSGFSNANFNGTTTITSIIGSTIRITSLNSTDGTGTGGQIVVTATQQNLQEWQYNSGTAVASVGPGGVITASSFAGSGASLTALNGANLTTGTVATTALVSVTGTGTIVVTDTAPTLTSPILSTAVYRSANNPSAVTTSVTVANILAGYVYTTISSTTTCTLPTLTNMNASFTGGSATGVEWSVVNTGSATLTLGAATGHVVTNSGCGSMAVAAGTSAKFFTRKTSDGAGYVTMRLA